jgi:hypothetical protein
MNEKITFGDFNGDRKKIEEIKNKDPEVFVLGNSDIEKVGGKFKFVCGFTVPEYKFYFAFGSMDEFPDHKDLFFVLEKLEKQSGENRSFQFRKGGRISFEEVNDKIQVKLFGFSLTYGKFNPDILIHFSEKLKLKFQAIFPGKEIEIVIE